MKKCAIILGILLAANTTLSAQFSVPQLGLARYADGSVHTVHGVAANLIVDPRIIATATSASFSDTAGLLSANGIIRLIRTDGKLLGEYQSSEPSPVLNLDSAPPSAAVWLPSKHLLLSWTGTQFVETPIDDSSFGGRVSFVSLASNATAQFFITRPDTSVARVSVALPSGRVTSIDTVPGARGPVLLQQGWILSQDEWGLIAERPNGNRQTVQLSQQPFPAGDLTLERMSDHWLHVSSRSTGTGWAVYLTATTVNIFLLPSRASEAAR